MAFVRFVLCAGLVHGHMNNVTYRNSLDLSLSMSFRGQYFEMYSDPIVAKYGQVIWPFQQTAYPLPKDVVSRYDNSVMTITGMESIIVTRVNGVERPAPCFHIYNHHWGGLVTGKNSDPKEIAANLPAIRSHSMHPFHARINGSEEPTIPTSLYWGQGNGNEYRGTYQGFPPGYGLLISSPTAFTQYPMAINIKNPMGGSGRYGPVPRVSHVPSTNDYSGLLECPCSDRRVIDRNASTIDGNTVSFDCSPDLIQAGNPSCSIKTYDGGIRCCNHENILLDQDQVFNNTDTYFQKFRIYYEDYQPETQNLYRTFFIQGGNSEHDVPKCADNTPEQDCVFTHVQNFTAGDIFLGHAGLIPANGFEAVWIAPHMHVAGLSMELWNLDTNEMLCHMDAVYGTSDEPLDEAGYIVALPPCAYQKDGSTPPPPRLFANTTLQVTTRYNSTYGHYGVMSNWVFYSAVGPVRGN